ncbi:MAG: HEAT repeat domain-containing protein, partial [Terriglobales bacterium]
PYLPRAVMAYLSRFLSRSVDDMGAADLLLKCRSDSVSDYVARAWRERVNAGYLDGVTAKLQGYLTNEKRALDAVRERLADENPAVRFAATQLLGEAGTLDDVALLSDLLSLPHSSDGHSHERQALLDAMWTIAHRE